MKFAFFAHVPWPEGTDQQQIIAQTTEQVQYAEALGFQGAWLAEHHFTRYSMVSSSLVLATYIAARTKKIRLGTAVVVSPLHNPIRVAEDTAMLDLVSGGRLDVGFGRGTSGYEYSGYNVDPGESQERLQDSIPSRTSSEDGPTPDRVELSPGGRGRGPASPRGGQWVDSTRHNDTP